jgi:hypothetical protein
MIGKSITLSVGAGLIIGGLNCTADAFTRIYKSSGTFTIPSSAVSSTEFEFTVVGAGGEALAATMAMRVMEPVVELLASHHLPDLTLGMSSLLR